MDIALSGNSFAFDHDKMPKSLPITFDDYVQLVDYNGRAIRYDKQGAISSDVPPVVMQPGITKNSWIDNRKSTKPSSTKSKFESDSKS